MAEAFQNKIYDIVIIGAGPAGSSAAQAAARRGAKALLIDRKQSIGLPVQCAEFVPQSIYHYIRFSPKCIYQTIETIVTHLPDQTCHEMKSPGYMLDRSIFDKELAAQAALSGAQISIETKALGPFPEGVIVERGSKQKMIKAKVIIGADGAHSSVRRWVRQPSLKTISALQYVVAIKDRQNQVEIFFDKKWEGGYAWFFPKGGTANVGIGVIPRKASFLPQWLNDFVQHLFDLRKLPGLCVIRKTGGAIPCGGPRQTVFGNMMLVGDAAGHAHSITGAGILNAVIGGEIAGRTAAEAILKEGLPHLKNYEEEWLDFFGKSLHYGALKRKLLEENWNKPGVNFSDLIRKNWVGVRGYYKDRKENPSSSPFPKEENHISPISEESPLYIQTSLAASLTLGLRPGSFHRNAKLKGLNLLLHYEEGCFGKCHFCGLSKSRQQGPGGRTFIRVDWPLYSLEEIIKRAKDMDQIHRVCISMITHPRALEDTLYIIRRIKQETSHSLSVLVAPTLIHDDGPLDAMKAAGADRAGIAVDTATPELFCRLRGKGAGGPHQWDHYWNVVQKAASIFGKFHVGIHLITGLGETEQEMAEAIQKGQGLGAHTHLFSFYPEKGSPMEDHSPPPVGQYRRIQLARWIINKALGTANQMKFDEAGRLSDFGTDINLLIQSGEPFMTSGCPGRDGKVACNRPYGNERPSAPIRNFPFLPGPEDIEEIKKQLK